LAGSVTRPSQSIASPSSDFKTGHDNQTLEQKHLGTARPPNSEIVDHSISIVMNVTFGVALK
jgi:hypothetical protein